MKEEIRFRLREWELTDKFSLAEQANNIRIWNRVRDFFPHPYTPEDGEAFIKMVKEKDGPPSEFAIEAAGKAVGGVGLTLHSDVERITAEIGYWLGEDYWNKGIMTQAVCRMTDYAFKQFDLVKIYAPVFAFNIASRKVLEKAGFELEAVLKKAAIKNGEITDMYYYSLIKTE
jgi:Acetyltransferases, including N-acetylases of ribosomal proteins